MASEAETAFTGEQIREAAAEGLRNAADDQ
jgi:hypothetical protein